jgi:hypothetical protein
MPHKASRYNPVQIGKHRELQRAVVNDVRAHRGKHRHLAWFFDYHHNRLPDWDDNEKDRVTGQRTHTADANHDYKRAYKDYNDEVEKFTGTHVEAAYIDSARRSLEAAIARGVNFKELDEDIFADLRDGTIAISEKVIGAPERVAAFKLRVQKQVVREALDEMEKLANQEGITEGHPDVDLLCQAFMIEVRERFGCLDEQFEPYEDIAAIEEMRSLDGIPLGDGLSILKRAKCAACAQELGGYSVERLGEDYRLIPEALKDRIRKKQSGSQEDDATTDGQDSEGDQGAGKQDPGGPTGQEPEGDTQPGHPPEDDSTGNSDDPATGSNGYDAEEDLDNAEDPVDGHNKTPIDLQPMLSRSVDDGIIGEDIGKGRRILAFYENTNTFLVEFRDGHLEVITEDSGSHIVARGLDWKPMASGPDDYHYDPADDGDGDNIDEGFHNEDDFFVFDVSEDLSTDNRLVSGSTFPSAGQFARRNQDIAQRQAQQKRPLAQRTFGPPGAPGTATNPGQQRFQPARPVV